MIRFVFARHAALVSCAALIAGCAGDPIKSITDFVTTPIVPAPQKKPDMVGSVQPASPLQARGGGRRQFCDHQQFKVPIDVDTAYSRAMRNFDFRTTEERRRYAERNSMGFIDEGFRHTAQPGAMYRMADYNNVLQGGQKRGLWTSMELWRDSAQQTIVKVDFCDLQDDASESTNALLRKTYRDAFN